jgi:general stress protein 26
MKRSAGSSQTREKLFAIIREIGVAMLATVRDNGSPHVRPMVTLFRKDSDNELWFFTAEHSAKTDEIEEDRHVAAAYADAKRNVYASLNGTASLVRDPALIQELWTPTLVTWFPGGKDDPNLALLRVKVRSGEYWDAPSSTMVEIIAAVQDGLDSPPPVDAGEHQRVQLRK